MKTTMLVVAVTTYLSSVVAGPQKQQQRALQAKDWYCVSQHMAETTDGDVIALPCLAALPKGEKLDAEDEDILTKLEIIRHNASTFKLLNQADQKPRSTDSDKGKEMLDAVRMGFGHNVGRLCQKHPNIALGSLFPDLASTNTLYACKNIIAVPEK